MPCQLCNTENETNHLQIHWCVRMSLLNLSMQVIECSTKMHSSHIQNSNSHFPLSGDSSDPQFPRPRDLDLIQSTPLETLSLKTPPRVLTLSERPLDFLEEEQRAAPESEEVVSNKAVNVLLDLITPIDWRNVLIANHNLDKSAFIVPRSFGPKDEHGGNAQPVRPLLVKAAS